MNQTERYVVRGAPKRDAFSVAYSLMESKPSAWTVGVLYADGAFVPMWDFASETDAEAHAFGLNAKRS